MAIAISGASGSYGRATVEGLLEKVPATDLILISRSPDKLAHFAERGCVVRKGDFDDRAAMIAALDGAETMLLISTGRVGRRVPQHGNAIDAAIASGVRHIVYTSFVGISDDNPALVIRDHGGTEAWLRRSEISWTALRDSQYADAMTDTAGPAALRAGVWRASTGQGRIAFVTREDCVACAVAVLSTSGHENRVYNITGPERLRFRDVAEIVGDVAGVALPYEEVSSNDMYAMLDAIGIPREAKDDLVVGGFPWSSDDMVSFERAIHDGYFDVISNDVEKLLGRPPESFRHFAERRVAILREAATQIEGVR